MDLTLFKIALHSTPFRNGVQKRMLSDVLQEASLCGDTGLHHSHLLRQDRHSDHQPDVLLAAPRTWYARSWGNGVMVPSKDNGVGIRL